MHKAYSEVVAVVAGDHSTEESVFELFRKDMFKKRVFTFEENT